MVVVCSRTMNDIDVVNYPVSVNLSVVVLDQLLDKHPVLVQYLVAHVRDVVQNHLVLNQEVLRQYHI